SELFELTEELTEAAGLRAYEISNHAAPGQESRHNLLYWRYGEYAGVGPGAHGRICADSGRLATVTESHPETWLASVEANGHGLILRDPVSKSEAADEMLLMGLRLTEGLDLARLAKVGGVRPSSKVIDDLVAMGVLWFDETADRLGALGRGRFILNEIVLTLSRS